MPVEQAHAPLLDLQVLGQANHRGVALGLGGPRGCGGIDQGPMVPESIRWERGRDDTGRLASREAVSQARIQLGKQSARQAVS